MINFQKKIIGLGFVLFALVGCSESTNKNGELQENHAPLIEETDEVGYEADVKISNTIPTEDLENGPFQSFYPNGEKQAEGMVVNGKRSGQWTSYHPAGNKQSENFYVNGELDGKTVVYYPNGQVMYIGYYSQGRNNGQWLYFDVEGTLTKEVIYKNGEVVSEVEKNEKPSE